MKRERRFSSGAPCHSPQCDRSRLKDTGRSEEIRIRKRRFRRQRPEVPAPDAEGDIRGRGGEIRNDRKQKNRTMEIKELQERVDAWIKEYGVRYFSELTNMVVLTEEVGELARVVARKYGDQSFKAGEACNLADEMADVLWVLVCLANQTGVDLTAALEANFAKKTSRDKERHRSNPKL